MFYTYMWLRQNATPWYVGKGKDNRAWERHKGHWAPRDRARILIQFWSSETEALEMEKYFIKLFGRKDLGTGILQNRNEGGFGGPQTNPDVLRRMSAAGRKHSLETRKRMGRPGLKRSAVTRARCSATAKLRSPERKQENAAHCRAMARANRGTSRLRGSSLSAVTRSRQSAAWTPERRVAQGLKMKSRWSGANNPQRKVEVCHQ